MKILESELILNEDGSIYHLQLKPGDIATTIITVGDPDRVTDVSKHFDTIDVTTHKREFKTQTGTYKGKRITVISTGIGTDNIDIVLNELDALVNVDFETRLPKKEFTQLEIIRIGTSGAIQKDIPIDSFLISEQAIGFDNLLHFYGSTDFLNDQLSEAFIKHTGWSKDASKPYVVAGDSGLMDQFRLGFNDFGSPLIKGFTATNVGFYGPQGRKIRLQTKDVNLNEKIASFQYSNTKITNFEMETSGIYGLARLLGHRALSLNAILANRASGVFSTKPKQTVDTLIQHTLDILTA